MTSRFSFIMRHTQYIVDEGEEGCEREGGDEERDEAVLDDHLDILVQQVQAVQVVQLVVLLPLG